MFIQLFMSIKLHFSTAPKWKTSPILIDHRVGTFIGWRQRLHWFV